MAVVRMNGISDLSDRFLWCREKGHHWKHKNDKVLANSGGQITLIMRQCKCTGCGTESEEVIEVPSMRTRSRKYFYADNYLLTKDGRAKSKQADVRRELFYRAGVLNTRDEPTAD